MSSGHILVQKLSNDHVKRPYSGTKTSKRARQAARLWHKRFERPCQATTFRHEANISKNNQATTMFLTTTRLIHHDHFFKPFCRLGAYHPKRPSLPTMTGHKTLYSRHVLEEAFLPPISPHALRKDPERHPQVDNKRPAIDNKSSL